MPKLKIDGLEIDVPQGTKVMEAADRLGIVIPRFCYHPALGPVGACRICGVMFTEGPVKGVQMSCMTEAMDGMVVSTHHAEAVSYRRQVVEWLMMNHPHDCPVCDEGGQCLLQDMTVAGGHGRRRYLGKKRTYRDQNLGIFVQHEMNRCIHCYRCVRFYQEFAGYRDLGAMQTANRTYFGRYKDGPLESPFAGNLVDICPTGVYTDKPARFKGRRWDFQRGASLCLHCSLGCHTVGSARYREVVAMEARFSRAVNGYFICDRGRFGFHYANHPQRPRRAKIHKGEVSWADAVKAAAERLVQIGRDHDPGSIASFGSSRSSLESQAMVMRISRLNGWRKPEFFETRITAAKVKQAVGQLDMQTSVSLREIEDADFLIVAGADPVNEAPMLALAMRQAFRKGARILVLDPRPVFLPFEFEHWPVPPAHIHRILSAFVKRNVDRSAAERLGERAAQCFDALPGEYPSGILPDRCASMGEGLKKSGRPVVVCGTDLVSQATVNLAADLVRVLKAEKGKAGLFYILPGPNAFGAGFLSPSGGSLEEIVAGIEEGRIRALILVESDPFRLFPNRQRVSEALGRLDFLLVLDYLPSEAGSMADIFLPTCTLFETESSFINQEGRLQSTRPFHSGGAPVEQVSGGAHPPRLFQEEIPGGEPRPAWSILEELNNAIKGEEPKASDPEVWRWMGEDHPSLAGIQRPLDSEGFRVITDQADRDLFSSGEEQVSSGISEMNVEVLPVEWTFGTEELSGYSCFIQQEEKKPSFFLQEGIASRRGLKNKDRVRIDLDGGDLEGELNAVSNMASGVLILPRHRQWNWQVLKEIPARISLDRIKKAD